MLDPQSHPCPVLLVHSPAEAAIARQLRSGLEPLVHRGHIRLNTLRLTRRSCLMPTVARAMLLRSRLFIVLLSPELLADPSAYALLELAVELARRRQVHVLPLVVRDVDIGSTPLHGWIRAVAEQRPLAHSDNLGATLCTIVRSIREGFEPATTGPRAHRPDRRKVLAVFASPPELAPLQLTSERRRVEQIVRRTDKLVLHSLSAATPADIHEALIEDRYDTVHISCHHEPGYGLKLHDACGKLCPIDPRGLAELFRGHGVRDLVLNMCRSDQLLDIFAGFDHIIAMHGALPDHGAIAFSEALYRSLAHGASLERAFTDARAMASARAPGMGERPIFHPRSVTSRGSARPERRNTWAKTLSLRVSSRFDRLALA